jgi:hypothetical protein
MGNVCRATRATHSRMVDVWPGRPKLSAVQEVNWRFIANPLIETLWQVILDVFASSGKITAHLEITT